MHDVAGLLHDFSTQPGGEVARLLRPSGWITIIAEHHLEQPGLGVDVMACATDPWAALHGGVKGPDETLAQLPVPVYWLEWDLCAGRSLEQPLWSACSEVELMTGPCLGPAPAESRALARDLLASLCTSGTQHRVELLVDAIADGGRLVHIAPLTPRGRAGVRLSWAIRVGAVVRWLRAVKHPAVSGTLPSLLFDLGPLHALVGVQLEVVDGVVGAYLAVESPLTWQARRPPTMALSAWLAPLQAPARRRIEALGAWVSAPPARRWRRQMYLKFTQRADSWFPKAYAGVTTAF